MKRARYHEALKKITVDKIYDLNEGIQLVLDTATTKFDESIDIAVKLGVNPKQADQQVRGALTLPHGLGKTVKVLVFAKGEKEQDAQDAGADFVGSDDMLEKIKSGWLGFDRVIATPDMMSSVAKVAKILGPKGKMPSPKTGSVTTRIKETVLAEKKGKASFRIDKQSLLHMSLGKKSMAFDKIKQNYLALTSEIIKLKPKTSKGIYLKSIYMSSSMGPSVRLNTSQTEKEAN